MRSKRDDRTIGSVNVCQVSRAALWKSCWNRTNSVLTIKTSHLTLRPPSKLKETLCDCDWASDLVRRPAPILILILIPIRILIYLFLFLHSCHNTCSHSHSYFSVLLILFLIPILVFFSFSFLFLFQCSSHSVSYSYFSVILTLSFTEPIPILILIVIPILILVLILRPIPILILIPISLILSLLPILVLVPIPILAKRRQSNKTTNKLISSTIVCKTKQNNTSFFLSFCCSKMLKVRHRHFLDVISSSWFAGSS